MKERTNVSANLVLRIKKAGVQNIVSTADGSSDPIIYIFNKYLLRFYHVPGTVKHW